MLSGTVWRTTYQSAPIVARSAPASIPAPCRVISR